MLLADFVTNEERTELRFKERALGPLQHQRSGSRFFSGSDRCC